MHLLYTFSSTATEVQLVNKLNEVVESESNNNFKFQYFSYRSKDQKAGNNESEFDTGTVEDRLPVFREREIVQIETMVFSYYREAKGSENDDDYECVICLNKFEDGQKCQWMKKCGHIFHCSCIDRWLRTERECPLCRSCVCVVVNP
ncbi:hypothetical protein Csa_019623 [Cucumis sativus]|nr:hypothetical protein Csa_019623 [Cucumis sativus]